MSQWLGHQTLIPEDQDSKCVGVGGWVGGWEGGWLGGRVGGRAGGRVCGWVGGCHPSMQ